MSKEGEGKHVDGIHLEPLAYESFNWDVIREADQIIRVILKLVKTDSYLLSLQAAGVELWIMSIGIGTGKAEKKLGAKLRRENIRHAIFGVDKNPKMVLKAQEAGFSVYEHTIADLLCHEPSLKNKFHFVISNATKHHIPDDSIEESTKVECDLLCPGGYTVGLTGASGYIERLNKQLIYRTNMSEPIDAIVSMLMTCVSDGSATPEELRSRMPLYFRDKVLYDKLFRSQGVRTLCSRLSLSDRVELEPSVYIQWLCAFSLAVSEAAMKGNKELLDCFYKKYLPLPEEASEEEREKTLAEQVYNYLEAHKSPVLGPGYAVKDMVRYFWIAQKPRMRSSAQRGSLKDRKYPSLLPCSKL